MRTLYHTPLLPACRKIRLIIAEKGLVFRLQQENTWEHRPDFLMLNPAGDVPVLEEENGDLIAGSYPITEYLEEKHPSPNLIGKSLLERKEIRRLVDWFDRKFEHEVTQKLLMEKVYKRLAKQGGPDTKALREGKQAIEYHMEYLLYLTEHNPWLAGDSMTIADLAAGAQLSAIDYLGDVPWNKFPEAKQWYAVLKSRPSFRAILADRMAGIIPPPYYENPDF